MYQQGLEIMYDAMLIIRLPLINESGPPIHRNTRNSVRTSASIANRRPRAALRHPVSASQLCSGHLYNRRGLAPILLAEKGPRKIIHERYGVLVPGSCSLTVLILFVRLTTRLRCRRCHCAIFAYLWAQCRLHSFDSRCGTCGVYVCAIGIQLHLCAGWR